MINQKFKKIMIIIWILSLQCLILNIIIIESEQSRNQVYIEIKKSKSELPNPSILDTWSTNGVPICIASGQQVFPIICSDGARGAIIIWRDMGNGHIYAQRVDSNGETIWSKNGVDINTLGGWNAQLCEDGKNGAIIAHAGPGTDLYVQRIDSNGNLKWGNEGIKICDADDKQDNPQLVSDKEGGAIITWRDQRNGWSNVYAQRIDSDGNALWEPNNGVPISIDFKIKSSIKIIEDGNKGAIITWQEGDIYAQRIDSEGNILWTPQNGVAICTADDSQGDPQLCSDKKEGAIITWTDNRGASSAIYAQKINSTGGTEWDNNGVLICDLSSQNSGAQICSDGAGGAIIGWEGVRAESPCIVYAQRINSDGQTEWANNGEEISIDSYEVQICEDSAGGAILTWTDGRFATSTDIYAQRINSAGKKVWDSNNFAICNASNNQFDPQICDDGKGGVIIAWCHANTDIYAQQVIYTQSNVAIAIANGNDDNNGNTEDIDVLRIYFFSAVILIPITPVMIGVIYYFIRKKRSS
ncbi:MAG: hypothetical protein ACFFBP_21235 [Promethearchaeota archaeon]